jgi:DHA1 family inner membrane transport protein
LNEKRTISRLFVPSIVLSQFSSMTPSILTGLLLIEIASTFNVNVGVAAQMNTMASTISMIFAIVLGILSVKMQAKTLMSIGLGLQIASVIGCVISPSLQMLILSYSLTGFASAIISPMSLTLIGENLNLEERGKAIGWIITGAALSYVIGAPIINTISDIGGWRLPFLGYVAPAAAMSLVLIWISIPFKERSNPGHTSGYFSGFQVVLGNFSAISCMLGNALMNAAYQAIIYFSSSFYRQVFQISKAYASVLIIGSALSFTFGSQVGGRLVNKYGRKTITIVPACISVSIIISYMNVPNFFVSILLRFLGSFIFAISYTGSRSLTLEQEPNYRGTMMSLNNAVQSMGTMIGSGLGGYLILQYSYGLMGVILGVFGLMASIVYFRFSVDPMKK